MKEQPRFADTADAAERFLDDVARMAREHGLEPDLLEWKEAA